MFIGLFVICLLYSIAKPILIYFSNECKHVNWWRGNDERTWSDDFQDRLIQQQIQRDQEQMHMDQDRLFQEQMHMDQHRLFQEQVQRDVEQQNRMFDQMFHDQMLHDQNQAFQNQMNNFNNPFF